MAAVIHNFVLEQGTSLNKKFRWKTNDQSVDLTGFTARSQFREALTSNNILIIGLYKSANYAPKLSLFSFSFTEIECNFNYNRRWDVWQKHHWRCSIVCQTR